VPDQKRVTPLMRKDMRRFLEKFSGFCAVAEFGIDRRPREICVHEAPEDLKYARSPMLIMYEPLCNTFKWSPENKNDDFMPLS
jgi:hypothetical protein